jgi:hypothetical protein
MLRIIRPRRVQSTSDTTPGDQDLIMDLLRLNRDYLTTHASPTTHAELTRFLHDRGIALDWFIDMLQLTTLNTLDHNR